MNRVHQEYEPEVPVAALMKHPRNPRRGNLSEIEESIERNGFYGAVLVQKTTGYILAGNHRYEVACEQNAPFIPVLWLDVDDETAMRILLGDNRINELGNWNEGMLVELLVGINESSGLEGTGYSEEDINDLINGATKERKPKKFYVRVECEDAEEVTAVEQAIIASGIVVGSRITTKR
jgi:ParB-like chromosome segregation protein Spo0J